VYLARVSWLKRAKSVFLGAPFQVSGDFSDGFRALDFSHLRRAGWVALRPSAQRKAISSWLRTAFRPQWRSSQRRSERAHS
jgi:hypothetical protein